MMTRSLPYSPVSRRARSLAFCLGTLSRIYVSPQSWSGCTSEIRSVFLTNSK